jgi:hypothetical protein
MRYVVLLSSLILLVASFLGMVGGGLAAWIWRRKLASLLRERQPSILHAAQASPDVFPLGIPMASSKRLLDVLRDAHIDDADVARVARTLRRCNTLALSSAAVLITLMLLMRIKPWY